jgi:UDP-N-acetylmuramoylalanine--D-glutamate ligase
MTYANRHVLVLGLGRSGCAAARLLVRLGARVTGYDRNPSRGDELGAAVERVSGDAPPDLRAFDAVIASPGFPLPAGADVVPEVDLAATQLEAPLVGVTGTNGKSTTVELIGDMLRRSGQRVAVGGNLGTALSALVDEPADTFVVELSSFQLERASRLHPRVAVLLNLAPDHLDRHGDLAAYGRAKSRLAALQTESDTLVVNLDDAWARRVPARAQRVGFTLAGFEQDGGCLDGKDLLIREAGAERVRISLEVLGPGVRAWPANALAAALAAFAAGASTAGVREALERFEGLPHRGRLVCVRDGIRYVDDSKATNPAAAVASVLAQPGPVIWLVGGRNKGLSFDALADAAPCARLAIAYGEAAPDLDEALGAHMEVARAANLDEAMGIAASRTVAGEVVLLAPACASFDQFASFEARGEQFSALARALPERGAEGDAEA